MADFLTHDMLGTEVIRSAPPRIRERLEDAKRECAERKGPDKPAPQKKPPELGDL